QTTSGTCGNRRRVARDNELQEGCERIEANQSLREMRNAKSRASPDDGEISCRIQGNEDRRKRAHLRQGKIERAGQIAGIHVDQRVREVAERANQRADAGVSDPAPRRVYRVVGRARELRPLLRRVPVFFSAHTRGRLESTAAMQ